LGSYQPDGIPPPPGAANPLVAQLQEAQAVDRGDFKATGDALLARIKELAQNCPPLYIEPLVNAYGQLIQITKEN
jgi:hypothetical protein